MSEETFIAFPPLIHNIRIADFERLFCPVGGRAVEMAQHFSTHPIFRYVIGE